MRFGRLVPLAAVLLMVAATPVDQGSPTRPAAPTSTPVPRPTRAPAPPAPPPSVVPVPAPPPRVAGDPTILAPPLGALISDAAARLRAQPQDLLVMGIDLQMWADSSLGCVVNGLPRDSAPRPGYSVGLRVGERFLDYRTDEAHNVAILCEVHELNPERKPTRGAAEDPTLAGAPQAEPAG